jgi:alanine racemase
MSGHRPTEARIDLSAIRGNLGEVRRAAGHGVIAVVKADAYGHGASAVAAALAQAGCRVFAVLSVDEAEALRAAGRDEEILVLGGVHDEAEAARAAALGLTPVIHHRGHAELLSRAADPARPLAVHVEVDTGMRRMGVPEAEAPELLAHVAGRPGLRLAGVYTHPARADEPDLEPTRQQLRRFGAVLEAARARGVDPGCVHYGNSAAALASRELGPDAPPLGAVRAGLALYGAQPAPGRPAALRPAMTLATRVVHLRDLARGDAVGYGGDWHAPGPTRVATLAVGYADGVPCAAAGRAQVAIGGRRFPVVGRVSMDFVTVDVGGAAPAIGDEALVFGAGPGAPAVEDLAAAAGTIAYEILVGVGPRVPRVVVDDDA